MQTANIREVGSKRCCRQPTSKTQGQRHNSDRLHQRNRAKDVLQKIYIREAGSKTYYRQPTSGEMKVSHAAWHVKYQTQA